MQRLPEGAQDADAEVSFAEGCGSDADGGGDSCTGGLREPDGPGGGAHLAMHRRVALYRQLEPGCGGRKVAHGVKSQQQRAHRSCHCQARRPPRASSRTTEVFGGDADNPPRFQLCFLLFLTFPFGLVLAWAGAAGIGVVTTTRALKRCMLSLSLTLFFFHGLG